jgi:hypothetical protein
VTGGSRPAYRRRASTARDRPFTQRKCPIRHLLKGATAEGPRAASLCDKTQGFEPKRNADRMLPLCNALSFRTLKYFNTLQQQEPAPLPHDLRGTYPAPIRGEPTPPPGPLIREPLRKRRCAPYGHRLPCPHILRRRCARRGWRGFPDACFRTFAPCFQKHFAAKYLAMQNGWLQFR